MSMYFHAVFKPTASTNTSLSFSVYHFFSTSLNSQWKVWTPFHNQTFYPSASPLCSLLKRSVLCLLSLSLSLSFSITHTHTHSLQCCASLYWYQHNMNKLFWTQSSTQYATPSLVLFCSEHLSFSPCFCQRTQSIELCHIIVLLCVFLAGKKHLKPKFADLSWRPCRSLFLNLHTN